MANSSHQRDQRGASFILGDNTVIKMFRLGLSAAALLEATPGDGRTVPPVGHRVVVFQGTSLSIRGSGGRPSTRSPMMVRWTSSEPPAMR